MPLSKPDRDDALTIVSARVQEAAEVMKAMASETRLKIMCALSGGELPVNQLAELTGQSQSAVSQHLAKLRAAGLVTSRRPDEKAVLDESTGHWGYTEPDWEEFFRVIRHAHGFVEMRRDPRAIGGGDPGRRRAPGGRVFFLRHLPLQPDGDQVSVSVERLIVQRPRLALLAARRVEQHRQIGHC